MPQKKSSEATVAARVEEVFGIIIRGGGIADIVRYGSENGWRVGRRQMEKYQARAYALIRELHGDALKRDHDNIFARNLAARRLLLALAFEAGDLARCHALLKDESEMLGMYPPKELKVDASVEARLVITETVVEGHGDQERPGPPLTAPEALR